jgi:hypothetical protein
MILASEGVCFLTRVSGKFRGAGESVSITRVDYNNDQLMQLGGTSAQEHVAASARCVYFKRQ